jgi:guanylate kinase
MPRVITITGPSRAGKSTTVDYLLECANKNFRPKLVHKYTTRSPREDDKDDEVQCGGVPPECDLAYEQYGERYGLESRILVEYIAKGQSPIVILNDVRAVEDVRNSFRERVRSIFIFRHDPLSEKYHQELIESRGEAGEVRFEKARTIHRIYIENIHLFDHVIINSGTCEELKVQMRQIVKSLEQDVDQLPREKE